MWLPRHFTRRLRVDHADNNANYKRFGNSVAAHVAETGYQPAHERG